MHGAYNVKLKKKISQKAQINWHTFTGTSPQIIRPVNVSIIAVCTTYGEMGQSDP